MPFHVRFQFTAASTLTYSVERLSDGLFWDFSGTQVFSASPATKTASLPEGTGADAGSYSATIATTPAAQWTDGNYAVRVYQAGAVVGIAGGSMSAGDDTASPLPAPAQSGYGPNLAGVGARSVDHNYGGTDALRYVAPGGAGIAGASIWAFNASDYSAGHTSAGFVIATATTGSDGRWLAPMMLNAGSYTLLFFKIGSFATTVQPLTVA